MASSDRLSRKSQSSVPPSNVRDGKSSPAAAKNAATPAAKNEPFPAPLPLSDATSAFGGSVRAERVKATAPPLPAQLMKTSNGVGVKHGDDAGDFYCEHTTWLLLENGKSPTTSLVRDQGGRGDPMCGFLHLPSDPATFEPPTQPPAYDLAQRHANTRQVVGAALRGFYDQVAPQVPKGPHDAPIKLQLTGFGPFESVQNNPTGEFVSNRSNIDAALDYAFGPNLVRGADGQPAVTETAFGPDKLYEYRVRDPNTHQERRVQILAAKMDVADTEIDNGPLSLQHKLATFKPQAALSMGVYPGETEFRAENRADTGGMKRAPGGGWKEVSGAPAKNDTGHNYALARAIFTGNQTIQLERPPALEGPRVA
jgi:pyrrolidone-carboxylate peptidase